MLDHTGRGDLFWIVLALLCFSRQLPGTCAENPLQLDPPSIVVRYGDPVSANCSTNVKHYGMGWEASQEGVELKEDTQFITWAVNNITHWDIKPICFMNGDGQHQAELNIIVYKPPDHVSISIVNSTGPMIEGREYDLQCDVQNVAPVRLLAVNWYKEQQLVKTFNFSEENTFPVDKTVRLQVSPRRGDDGVQYRCEAELKLGPEGPQPSPIVKSAPITVTVHYGPNISCELNYIVEEGQDFMPNCTAVGFPQPILTWYKDMEILQLPHIMTKDDAGQYVLEARNNHSTVNHTLEVEVLYGPNISCELNYIVEEGQDFMPNCTAVGFPQPNLTWYKDMEILQLPHIMTKDDAGQYVLEARNNNNSTDSHTLEVEVLYPPRQIVELESAQVSRGNNVILKCSSKGKPQPSYKWIYHQTSNVHVSDQDGVSLLNITHAREDNIGTYTCIADNSLGKENRTVRVDIRGAKASCPLSINSSVEELEYGESVNITCTSSKNDERLSLVYLNKTYHEFPLVINSRTVTDWNISVSCRSRFVGLGDCTINEIIHVYKRPDNVFVSTVNHTATMIEGRNYTLRCDVRNVAPIQLLTVNWYEGEDLLKNQTFNTTKNPDDISMNFKISPRRNNTQYKCEAKLEFKSKKTVVVSNISNIVVYAKPSIKKLPDRVPLFRGYPVQLVCEASGFPDPIITWSLNNETLKGVNLKITDTPGEYNCTASNAAGTVTQKVIVETKDVNCDLVLIPSELTVEYGDSASADCATTPPSSHTGMGWKASHGAVDMIHDAQLVTWKLDSVTDWDIQPTCFLNTSAWQCETKLHVTVFKLPDRVTVSTVGHTGPMIEGKPYELRCDVYNIAPVHLLTVNWYKGQHLVAKTFFSDPTKTPVNQSTRFQLSLSRADDGVRYRCEAVLNLGLVKPSSKMASQVLGLTVHYRPRVTRVLEILNETSEDGTLNCTVDANPPPRYTWYSSSLQKEFNKGNPVLPLSSVGSGNYTCTASNGIGSVSKMFFVRVKPRDGNNTIFWAIVGPFVGLAVVMIVGYCSKQGLRRYESSRKAV